MHHIRRHLWQGKEEWGPHQVSIFHIFHISHIFYLLSIPRITAHGDDNNSGDGCWSYNGKQVKTLFMNHLLPVAVQGGEQVINLAEDCMEWGVITHEVLHALGQVHEHNRLKCKGSVQDKQYFTTISAGGMTLTYVFFCYKSLQVIPDERFWQILTKNILMKKKSICQFLKH